MDSLWLVVWLLQQELVNLTWDKSRSTTMEIPHTLLIIQSTRSKVLRMKTEIRQKFLQSRLPMARWANLDIPMTSNSYNGERIFKIWPNRRCKIKFKTSIWRQKIDRISTESSKLTLVPNLTHMPMDSSTHCVKSSQCHPNKFTAFDLMLRRIIRFLKWRAKVSFLIGKMYLKSFY